MVSKRIGSMPIGWHRFASSSSARIRIYWIYGLFSCTIMIRSQPHGTVSHAFPWTVDRLDKPNRFFRGRDFVIGRRDTRPNWMVWAIVSRRMQQTLGTASNLSPLKAASVKYRGKTIIYSVFNKNVDTVLSGETYSFWEKNFGQIESTYKIFGWVWGNFVSRG